MSQRKRATGFALMDTAFAADAKFVRLARKAGDPVSFAAAVGVFWLLLADARRARDAVLNWEDYTEYQEQIAALKEAKLLTVNGFDGETFDRWAPAYRSLNERTQAYPSVPNVPNRTQANGDSEHGAYPTVPTVPNRTASTLTSTHIISNQGEVGGVGEGEPRTFMSYRPTPTLGSHDGQHPHCRVCAPIRIARG